MAEAATQARAEEEAIAELAREERQSAEAAMQRATEVVAHCETRIQTAVERMQGLVAEREQIEADRLRAREEPRRNGSGSKTSRAGVVRRPPN